MTHLALGDYVYQRQFLRQLKEQNPHLLLDIWIDDCRVRHKTWHQGRNQTLCQWLEAEPFINNIYPIATNAETRSALIQKASKENYDLVFFIAMNRSSRFAKIARTIAPHGIVVGTKSAELTNPLSKWLMFKRLDSYLDLAEDTCSPIRERFANCFSACLGLQTDPGMMPDRINIPAEYALAAKNRVEQATQKSEGKTLFINHLSTSEKRDYSWQQTRRLLLKLADVEDSLTFFLNVPPDQVNATQAQVKSDPSLSKLNLFVFCATEHFFQLPAMIDACDFVISVETAVMHIAAALQKPQLILMRQSAKQWQPPATNNVLFGDKRVDQIEVEDAVNSALKHI